MIQNSSCTAVGFREWNVKMYLTASTKSNNTTNMSKQTFFNKWSIWHNQPGKGPAK
jgi:hypothetical protein